jgi:hypothetical protein
VVKAAASCEEPGVKTTNRTMIGRTLVGRTVIRIVLEQGEGPHCHSEYPLSRTRRLEMRGREIALKEREQASPFMLSFGG